MADLPPVNSPRRVLSLSRTRRDAGSFLDVEDKTSGIGLSGQRGPKPAEVYGFVGSITTVVATGAIALPTYCMVVIVLTLAFYIGLNFMATPPPTSFNVIYDEHSREPEMLTTLAGEDDRPIEPISDIGIHQINEFIFKDSK
ncbi:hypothetical protein KSS87_004203 [Heliosperma pusillum]|nr:hypothetical protein KSS87_004203 [Heliosperma pusillum]